MDKVSVLYKSSNKISIENKSIVCPFCNTTMIPIFHYLIKTSNTEAIVFAQCTHSLCAKGFITKFKRNGNQSLFLYEEISSNSQPQQKVFSKIITSLSPNFIEIYNQAYTAEQLNLNQICGTGYRKALEFLIKDYLISIIPEDQHESIKNKLLGNCIRDYVQNINMKNVASRATWIGNDETHYTRKWENKAVSDLKGLINLTIHWIESEIETKHLLQEMPNPKKEENFSQKV